MANKIRLKRSTSAAAPSSLEQGEPAYVEQAGSGDGRLYIGVNGAAIEEIGGKYYVDKINAISAFGVTLIDDVDAAAARTTLGLAIGTDVQAYDADLAIWAGLTPSANGQSLVTAANYAAMRTLLDLEAGTDFYSIEAANSQFVDVAGDTMTGDLTLAASEPIFTLRNTGASSNEKNWSFRFTSGGNLSIDTATDAAPGTGVTNGILFTRDGTNIDQVTIPSFLAANNGLYVTGNISLTGVVDGRDVATDGSKLDGIEALADVTDATNVDAAGAVMNSDASTAGMSFVIDEDSMVSNSATKIPTQQSVKAYVDTALTGALTHKGGYNASTDTPALDTGSPTLEVGDMYTVTAAGTFFTVELQIGDVLIADVDSSDAASVNDWTIVQANIGAASEVTSGYIELATQAEMDTATDDLRAVTPLKFANSTINGGTFSRAD